MSRAEFVRRTYPVIKKEHQDAARLAKNFKKRVAESRDNPEKQARYQQRLEESKALRDSLLIVRERLHEEKVMWNEYRRTL